MQPRVQPRTRASAGSDVLVRPTLSGKRLTTASPPQPSRARVTNWPHSLFSPTLSGKVAQVPHSSALQWLQTAHEQERAVWVGKQEHH